MKRIAVKMIRYAVVVGVTMLLTLIVVRVVMTRNTSPLQRWHTYAPDELNIAEIDRADWIGYLNAEQRVFEQVRREVVDKLPVTVKVTANRYYAGSPLYPANLSHDWNRSFILEPDGEPAGVVVLLHGLTDSPYSLRHIGQHYRDRGYVAIAIRMPAHGTVPAGLAHVRWQAWRSATRLAIREARRRVAIDKPLHLVGYSMGAALALDYSLDALDDPELAPATRLVLISPMIGVREYARYADVAGWPAMLPPLARTAWSDVLPEFNPFKYNSFTLNAARQAYLLSSRVQQRMNAQENAKRLNELPPILCFQSVVDDTVDATAVISALFAKLPENDSEVVLFDVNRAVHFGPLLSVSADTTLKRMWPAGSQRYRTIIIGNPSGTADGVIAQVIEPGDMQADTQPLPLRYPASIFSLSHIALPFPETDSLYGSTPDSSENYGVHLGALALRGERGVLVVNTNMLTRVSFNPFFPYMLQKIDQYIDTPEGMPLTGDREKQQQ